MAEGWASDLEILERDCEATKENALRQLEHLRREIDYGYGAPHLRETRRTVNQAFSAYFTALDWRAKAVRKAARGGGQD